MSEPDIESEQKKPRSASTREPESSQAQLVPIVEVEDVTRIFTSPSGAQFTAIEHVDLVIEDLPGKGRDEGHPRAVWVRQVDASEHDRRARHPDHGQRQGQGRDRARTRP